MLTVTTARHSFNINQLAAQSAYKMLTVTTDNSYNEQQLLRTTVTTDNRTTAACITPKRLKCLM